MMEPAPEMVPEKVLLESDKLLPLAIVRVPAPETSKMLELSLKFAVPLPVRY